jgi:hypothetical protein
MRKSMKRSTTAVAILAATIIACAPAFAQSTAAVSPAAAPVVAAPATPPPLDLGDCPDGAGAFDLGKTYQCSCPPNAADGSSAGAVYGSLVYANDSNICAAAVHAGVLKPATAGSVTIKMIDSPPVFKSTTQNGIKSEVWTTATSADFQFAPVAKL